MTEFLVFLGFLVLVIGAWAPARIDALRSGRSRYDSRFDSVRDTDRDRSQHDLALL